MIHSAARSSFDPGAPAISTPAALLADLKGAHAGLVIAIGVLGRLTSGPLPDRGHYAAARWRISQASLARRIQWGRIYRELIAGAGKEDAALLNQLQADDMNMLRRSAAHVGKWTMAAIDEDWRRYSQASRALLREQQARIDLESRLLYPMLERLARSG